jgi:hypothetical protein
MSDELKERNVLKLISIVRFACATLDVGHPMQIDFNEHDLKQNSPIRFNLDSDPKEIDCSIEPRKRDPQRASNERAMQIRLICCEFQLLIHTDSCHPNTQPETKEMKNYLCFY